MPSLGPGWIIGELGAAEGIATVGATEAGDDGSQGQLPAPLCRYEPKRDAVRSTFLAVLHQPELGQFRNRRVPGDGFGQVPSIEGREAVSGGRVAHDETIWESP